MSGVPMIINGLSSQATSLRMCGAMLLITLNIDVVDRAQKQLLWEGIAIGRITQKMYENLEPTIDAVVKEVFLKFPKQPPQT